MCSLSFDNGFSTQIIGKHDTVTIVGGGYLREPEPTSFEVGEPREIERHTTFQFVVARNELEAAEIWFQISMYGLDQGQFHYPAHHSGSEQSFNQIARWITQCKQKHPNCARHRTVLPRRLLKIQTGCPDKVLLCRTQTLADRNIQYLALSYCWGNSTNVQSLKVNISDREAHGLDVADLPAVIKDAVTVTDGCGYHYLWVDALCICQDDKQEWEVEATAMADIYGGSVFTILALSSLNTEMSFLRPRNLSIVPIGTINDLVESESHIHEEFPLSLFIREAPQSTVKEIKGGRLGLRAWPLQERILPPAVLHFGRDQLFWECNENGTISETGKKEFLPEKTRLMNLNCHNAMEYWERLVTDLNRRDLTIFSDRLNAISGLASKLREMGVLDGRYVAGLWEKYLDCLLMWDIGLITTFNHSRNRSSRKVEPPIKNTQISTWSWAHMDKRSYSIDNNKLVCGLQKPPTFQFENEVQSDLSLQPGAIVSSCQVLLHGLVQRIHFDDFVPFASNKVGSGLLTKRIHSIVYLDELAYGPGPCYAIRMMYQPYEDSADRSKILRVEYLLLARVESEKSSPIDQHFLCRRIGRLTVTFEYEKQKPTLDEPVQFLENGQWLEVVLI